MKNPNTLAKSSLQNFWAVREYLSAVRDKNGILALAIARNYPTLAPYFAFVRHEVKKNPYVCI